jgi:hypothetical protein
LKGEYGMMTGLLWMMVGYGMAIAGVHWMHHKHLHHAKRKTIYILVTRDNQLQIEWYIRSLSFFALLKGTAVSVFVRDEGSTDDTLKIVERMITSSHVELEEFPAGMTIDEFLVRHERDPIVMVRLSSGQRSLRLPLVQ